MSVAAVLPLVGIAASVLMMTTPTTPEEQYESDEEKRNRQYLEEMRTNGASAATWQTLHNKQFLGGQALRNEAFAPVSHVNVRNTNVDNCDVLRYQHANLAQFDRLDTLYRPPDGEIRMRRRMAIADPRTPEIVQPNAPWQQSNFLDYKFHVDKPNAVQLRQAMQERDFGVNNDPHLRNYYDVPFFARAPGQSFRYE